MTTLLDVMGLLVLLWAATRVGQMKLPPSMRTITWILVLLLLALHAADIAQAVVVHTSLPDEVSDVLAGGLPFVWASLLMQMAEVLAERRAQATRDQLGFFFSEVPAGVLSGSPQNTQRFSSETCCDQLRRRCHLSSCMP
jgi:hypothetical protein